MVVNEYGDNLGIVCLEDMLEIVFGDFTTDAPHRSYLMIKEDDGSYIVDGAALVLKFHLIMTQ
jgi:Mg2+/Co2+ transporter CorB